MVIPEMAQAAQPGLSPSLNNFLLSIASGGAHNLAEAAQPGVSPSLKNFLLRN
ncbi:hypothetical protein KSP40_PGU005309 [Platanthera guangdongensis]|uniref:Uncharacterized protein n=1 Tax=Platanthera guangdongensis TaxID=2320717 RepID=A0ABR2LRP8_9ASPA